MSGTKHPKIALCYDFDGTLSPRNMQEYSFIPQLAIDKTVFWRQVAEQAKNGDEDNILSYMHLMLKKAKETGHVRVARSSFKELGTSIDLFPGVEDWFQRINEHARSKGAKIEHYIISSGLKEIIEGTKIAKQFKMIYASSYSYDQHDVAIWPALAINYTTKTQYLFRINKGVFDVWDHKKVNEYKPESERYIPFNRFIYIGDGSTDVPCMKLTKTKGGHSIAVYKPKANSKAAKTLLGCTDIVFT
ncbi:conserved hypothetical protein [Desulfarculus baarsii DSM 2075]|uniref:Phosphoserine phosphatase n=1 Tax=Desulfarculus baarsii (strain ATCC 33931 / DSM 2075 / LMG 7858 / VKM B-1802 / 2st14) TaxID=644282 RepID=E1QE80_DESB2|nr:HAD family hydrolase [Desulfarculus baarsii]ADK83866.1 conserved hypothetical protein [Desulfarculus baarsii DSM 2075]